MFSDSCPGCALRTGPLLDDTGSRYWYCTAVLLFEKGGREGPSVRPWGRTSRTARRGSVAALPVRCGNMTYFILLHMT